MPKTRAGAIGVVSWISCRTLVVAPFMVGCVRPTAAPTEASSPQTSSTDAGSDSYSAEIAVSLNRLGPADVVEKSRGRGDIAMNLQARFTGDQSELRRHVEQYVSETYRSKEPRHVVYGGDTDAPGSFHLELEARNAAIGQTDFLYARAEVAERAVFTSMPQTSTRGLPSHQAELTWHVSPPPGFVPTYIPRRRHELWGAGRFDRDVVEKSDGSVQIHSRFTWQAGPWSPVQIADLRKGWESYRKSPVNEVAFTHRAQVAAKAGDYDAALKLLSQEQRDGQRDGVSEIRLALVLTPLLHHAARKIAEKATVLASQSSSIWLGRAQVHSHNVYGQWFGAGFDREGAIAAYRRAVELDPEDPEPRFLLALTLEHDASGVLGRSPDLPEAIALFESVPEKTLIEFQNGYYARFLLAALFSANRLDELALRLDHFPKDRVPTVFHVLLAASRSGPAAAVSAADRLGLKGSARTADLRSGAAALIDRERFAEAAELLRFAAVSAKKPSEILDRADVLAKARAVDAATLPEATPGEMVIKFLATLTTRPEGDKEPLSRFLSRRALADDGRWSVSETAMTLPLVPHVPESPSITSKFVSVLVVTEEGDDALGYRVVITNSRQESQRYVAYVVRESGTYKVCAFGANLDEIGAEAHAAYVAKNHAKAARWLNWAREDFTATPGDDPLLLPPFMRLWTASDRAAPPSPATIELAALSMGALWGHPDLRAELIRLRAASTSTEVRQILAQVLVASYDNDELWGEALPIADELQRQMPRSKVAQEMVARALYRLKRFEEYRTRLKSWQSGLDDDAKIQSDYKIAASYGAQGKIDESLAILRKLIATGRATPNVFNDAAWASLFQGADKADVESAIRAAQVEPSPTHLHTLASVYADLGRIEDARATFERLLRTRARPDLQPQDWFILGRIAEQLGLLESAREAYGNVSRPTDPMPNSTYELSRRRLSRL